MPNYGTLFTYGYGIPTVQPPTPTQSGTVLGNILAAIPNILGAIFGNGNTGTTGQIEMFPTSANPALTPTSTNTGGSTSIILILVLVFLTLINLNKK